MNNIGDHRCALCDSAPQKYESSPDKDFGLR